jgi:hypothetical protein
MNLFRRVLQAFLPAPAPVNQHFSPPPALSRPPSPPLPRITTSFRNLAQQREDEELQSLRGRVQVLILEKEVLEADRDAAWADTVSLRANLAELNRVHERLGDEINRGHPPGAPYKGPLDSVRLQREMHEQLRENLSGQLVDLAGRMEETTSTIAFLEGELRKRGIPVKYNQAPLIDVEGGGEMPEQADEVITDNVQELAYRLVSIWFEGRHYWDMARGEDRIKAPIADQDFLAKMRSGEQAFIAGDTLVADFRVITYRRLNGEVYGEFSVEKVKRVIHPDEQVSLAAAETLEVAHV